MSDIQKQITEATERIVALQQERSDAEKSANAHEEQARADRRRMSDIKNEIAQLQQVLGHNRVVSATEEAAKAAQASKVAADQSRSEADAILAQAKEREEKLTTQEKRLEALIAKAEEAAKPVAKPTE